jgi:uncharacterized membrane protein
VSDSTTGLSTRTASVLSYLGWWVTGLLFWAIERRDAVVLFHAVQATVAFGSLAVMMTVLALIGLVMLSFAPAGFTLFMTAAAAVWGAGLALWLVSLWKASQGERWRIPLAARVAEKATGASAAASS